MGISSHPALLTVSYHPCLAADKSLQELPDRRALLQEKAPPTMMELMSGGAFYLQVYICLPELGLCFSLAAERKPYFLPSAAEKQAFIGRISRVKKLRRKAA